MSETLLVTHCSPTLAGIKTGNLFTCECSCTKQLRRFILQWNEMLNPKGVYIKVMRLEKGRALIYVYRKARLEQALKDENIRRFLERFGYDVGNPADGCPDTEKLLVRLSRRIRLEGGFPHEIGVFLGYPFEDVMGFIENNGKNFKHTGHWKVYSDEVAAKKIFSNYKKCTDIYCRKLKEGCDLMKLTVEGRLLANVT